MLGLLSRTSVIAQASFLLCGPHHWLTAKLILSEPPRCCVSIILMGWLMPQLPWELNFIPDRTWGGEAEKGVILTLPVASLSQLTTVRLLPVNLQVVSFQRREHAFPCPIAEVLESGMRCHKWATSASACAFAYFTVLYWVQYYSIFISSPGCLETSIKATWHSWYCTFQGTVLKYWKYFLFYVCFLCIIWVRSIINLS